MIGVLTGFAIIGVVIVVGYVIERLHVLPKDSATALNRFVYFIASPALLFTVLAKADLSVIFSSFLAVTIVAIAVTAAVFLVLSRLFFRRPAALTALGTASSSYVNANNIGLPVAVYVLGSAQFVAPVLMFQLIVMAPILLTVLDLSTRPRGSVSIGVIVSQPFRNPIIVASLAGLMVALTGIHIPDQVFAPFALIGGAAVPTVLITFGMSLVGRQLLPAGGQRLEIITAVVLKSVLMPLAAYLAGSLLFHLDAVHLFSVVVLAALPTAQNMFNYAFRFNIGVEVTRDIVLLTTIAAVPAMLVISALLAPS